MLDGPKSCPTALSTGAEAMKIDIRSKSTYSEIRRTFWPAVLITFLIFICIVFVVAKSQAY